eukprot:478598-Rhodomonas_salina.2
MSGTDVAMYGTDVAYGATSATCRYATSYWVDPPVAVARPIVLRARYAMSGTNKAYRALVLCRGGSPPIITGTALRFRYAMPGTDIDLAMQCPVLTQLLLCDVRY